MKPNQLFINIVFAMYMLLLWLRPAPLVPWINLYLFSWWIPYLFLINLCYYLVHLRSLVASSKELLWTFLFSGVAWTLFEVLNLRIDNWYYVGYPENIILRWGYLFLSFTTVLPAVLWTARLFHDEPLHKVFMARPFPLTLFICGVIQLCLLLIWPERFFPLFWTALFCLFDPFAKWLGAHSLVVDWEHGRWKTTGALMLAGLVCGIFWEFTNGAGGPMWIYHIPYANFGHVFKMPLLGYLAYPFFCTVDLCHGASVF